MRELHTDHPIEQEELMAYLDGELSVDKAAAASAHLQRCPECQALAADLQGVSQRMRAWQVESSDPCVTPALVEELNERRKRTRRSLLSVRRVPLWGWCVATVFAVALLFVPQMTYQNKMAPPVAAQIDSLKGPRDRFLQAPPARQQGQPGAQTSISAARAVPELARTKTPLIVRTAQLTLATNEFDKARGALEDILKRHRGYFGQLNVNAPLAAGRVLESTLRIPSDQLEAAMGELKRLGRVESETQGGEEVTQQYTDLEARLSNARNTEKRLTELLRERTGKLADVLSVEMEIDRTREAIERMDAEKKDLLNRVDFATLNVRLVEGYKAELQVVPDSTFNRFRNAAVEGYRSMVEGMVSAALILLSYGPTILLWAAILFFPARFAWKRRRPIR